VQGVQFGNDVVHFHELDISIDVHSSQLTGISRLDVKAGQEVVIRKGSLKITEFRLNDLPADYHETDGIIQMIPEQSGIIQIHYEGVFKDSSPEYDVNRGIVQDIIDERGVSLTGIWYPKTEDLRYYKLRVTLPKGYEAISEAEEIQKIKHRRSVEFHLKFPYPLDSINLVASKHYKILKDRYRDVKIYAYFFREDKHLAKRYIEFTKRYLKMYEKLFTKFPYKRFSIVENFLPTGYSMPTFTLLGKTVVKLPFIVETSLGHEILHQWFGNHVYIDYKKGNWAEGLTTYLADHLYQEEKGKDWEYRKQILIEYKSSVTEKNEFALKDFIGRTDSSSKAIGYGKCVLVFHMLKNMVGEKKFFDILKDIIREYRFQLLSWEDIKTSFEKFYGESLEVFFKEWIDEKGMPELLLEDARAAFSDGVFKTSFTVIQKGNLYSMHVPVSIHTDSRRIKRTFKITDKENTFDVFLSDKPVRIVLDEDYDIARALDRDEFPPVVARLLKDEQMIVSMPDNNMKLYNGIIDYFQEKGAVLKKAEEIKESDIKSSSIIVCGRENQLIKRLYGKLPADDAGFSIYVRENPWNTEKVVGIFHGTSEDEVEAAFRKIVHYGKYSTLLFNKGVNTDKRRQETERGISIPLIQDYQMLSMG
jgi:hypothetical protein